MRDIGANCDGLVWCLTKDYVNSDLVSLACAVGLDVVGIDWYKNCAIVCMNCAIFFGTVYTGVYGDGAILFLGLDLGGTKMHVAHSLVCRGV